MKHVDFIDLMFQTGGIIAQMGIMIVVQHVFLQKQYVYLLQKHLNIVQPVLHLHNITHLMEYSLHDQDVNKMEIV
jgi:hypothetical protein